MKLEKVDFTQLAHNTDTFNGAEIKAVCTEAGMFAIRDRSKKVNMVHFMKAIEKVKIKDRASIFGGDSHSFS